MIELKSAAEIDTMRAAGQIVAGVLLRLSERVAPGLTTKALDMAAREYIDARGAVCAFVGYRGFPAAVCISVNDEVVHGIPGERELSEGDLVSIDAGAIVDGFYADAAVTVSVGRVCPDARRLMDTTRRALAAGIAQATVGHRLSDISHAVQETVEREGFGVVRDFVGHGIGRMMHEDPPIPNFGLPNTGPRLERGMVLAIEPMVTMRGYAVRVLADGWTAVTCDGSLAAHFEHTIAITAAGPEILTQLHAQVASR